MPRFAVRVENNAPEHVVQALDRAGIQSIGPAFPDVSRSPDTTRPVSRLVTAVVSADSEEAAAARVREVVGDDCEITEVKPYVDRPQ